jgi:hypothetical protein
MQLVAQPPRGAATIHLFDRADGGGKKPPIIAALCKRQGSWADVDGDNFGGEEGIRTLDTPLERITV